MSLMYWTHEIAIGVETIDNQHKELIERINALVTAFEEERETEEIGRLFAFLHDYTQEHFGAEEELMRACRYPDSVTHLAEHEKFRATLTQLEAQIHDRGLTGEMRSRFGELIIDWLFDHICDCDRKLGKFLNASP